MSANDGDLVDRMAKKHSVSPAAVQVVLAALRSGGGRMAQFSHADFGGMSQWSPGMSMVGDMFNTQLKAKLDALWQILHDRRMHRRWVLAAAFAVAVSFALAPAADAKGCIKGTIVGGVAGHMAGHGKLGAAAGCVVGHHEANKADANKANAQAPSDQK
jgi:hypothetical protein